MSTDPSSLIRQITPRRYPTESETETARRPFYWEAVGEGGGGRRRDRARERGESEKGRVMRVGTKTVRGWGDGGTVGGGVGGGGGGGASFRTRWVWRQQTHL